jgi:hypothetical protein
VSCPANDFTYTLDLFEDGVAGCCPDERAGFGVASGDEGLDLGDEIFGADRGRTSDLSLGEEWRTTVRSGSAMTNRSECNGRGSAVGPRARPALSDACGSHSCPPRDGRRDRSGSRRRHASGTPGGDDAVGTVRSPDRWRYRAQRTMWSFRAE